MLKPRLLLMAALPLLPLFTAAPASADFIYGIGDDNRIYEVDTTARTTTPVFSTGLSGLSNAFAYDAARRQLFFIDAARNLRVWGGGSALPVVATAGTIGGSQPANAAYFNNSYWYFDDGSNRLNQLNLEYSNPSAPTVTSKTTLAISGITSPGSNRFGDIAIDGSGVLFGATSGGTLFSLNLNNPTSTYAVIRSGNPSLQLSFDAGFGTLFAQDFGGGQWYTVNTGSGVITPITGFTSAVVGSNGLRDLGGAGSNSILVPGPLPLAGAVAALGFSRRLRRRIRRSRTARGAGDLRA